MTRFALFLLVGLLAFSTSGMTDVLINEPCAAFELPGSDDRACPPTCVTCGCCAQSAMTAVAVAAPAPDIVVDIVVAIPPDIPRIDPRDVFHVPKARA